MGVDGVVHRLDMGEKKCVSPPVHCTTTPSPPPKDGVKSGKGESEQYIGLIGGKRIKNR